MSKTDKISKLYVYVCILVLCIFSSSALLMSGVIEAHDTFFHIMRLESLVKSINNGQLRLYVAPEMLNNFGYATSLFYCDFMLYLPAFLVCAGVSLLTSYKLLLILICVLTVASSFYMAKEILDNDIVALFCASVVSCSSYFYTDVFVRGALGESIAFIFVPLVIAGIYNLFYGNKNKWWQLAVGFSGLLMSHILSFLVMCIVFTIFIAIYIFDETLLHKKKLYDFNDKICPLLKAIFSAICRSAWFLFPIMEQMLTTEFLSSYFAKTYNPMNSAIRVRNLFIQVSESGVFTPGLGLVMLLFLTIWLFALLIKHKDTKEWFVNYCGIISVMCIIGSTSLFPWTRLDPYLNIIQFPWRLHLFTTVLLSLAGSYWIVEFGKKLLKNKFIVFTFFIAVLQIVSYNISAFGLWSNSVEEGKIMDLSKEYHYYDENYLHINANRNVFANRSKYEGKIRGTRYNIQGECEYPSYGEYKISFEKNNYRKNSLEMPIHYYKGYKVLDENGKVLDNFPSSARGWLTVNITDYDSGELTVVYAGTAIQKLSLVFSVCFFIGLGVYLFYHRMRINILPNKA